jgi:hypothetical protein
VERELEKLRGGELLGESSYSGKEHKLSTRIVDGRGEIPVISDWQIEPASRLQVLKKRTVLKKQAIDSLKQISQWYNNNKNKAMKSYISAN